MPVDRQLSFSGAYLGYKQDAFKFPVNTSNIPRQIPDQPWFIGIPLTLAIWRHPSVWSVLYRALFHPPPPYGWTNSI
jgi:hypothetical protein